MQRALLLALLATFPICSAERAFAGEEPPVFPDTPAGALAKNREGLDILESLEARFYAAEERTTFLPNESGLSLRRGGNFFLFAKSSLALSDWFDAVAVFRERTSATGSDLSVHRAYAKATLRNFSLETGVDNVQLGPGKWGLLLSENTDPYPLLKIQTEEPIRFFGKWRFVLVSGFLPERREDVTNPRVFGARFSWEVFDLLEVGVNRTTLWGGRGRPAYHFWEWPKFVAGTDENVSNSRYDNDAYFSYDFTLRIPFHKVAPILKTFELYWQGAGTDTRVPWQEEDGWSKAPKLHERAFQLGHYSEIGRTRVRIEYVVTAYSFFRHHIYDTEGFSYGGLSLGYPYGGNMQSLYAEIAHSFSENLRAKVQGGVRQSPCFSTTDHERGYFATLVPSFGDDVGERRIWFSLEANHEFSFPVVRAVWLGGYFRFEASRNYDENPLPAQFEIVAGRRTFLTMGITLTLQPDLFLF